MKLSPLIPVFQSQTKCLELRIIKYSKLHLYLSLIRSVVISYDNSFISLYYSNPLHSFRRFISLNAKVYIFVGAVGKQMLNHLIDYTSGYSLVSISS